MNLYLGGVHWELASFLNIDRHRFDPVGQFDHICAALIRHSPAYMAFSNAEQIQAKELLALARGFWGSTWWHGGRAGLLTGQKLLPAAGGGRRNNDAWPRPLEADRWVYVSPRKDFAQGFANAVKGNLYGVIPDTEPMIHPAYLRTLNLLASWNGCEAIERHVPHCLVEFVCRSATISEVCEPVDTLYHFGDRTAKGSPLVGER